jgi:hypothetical protein
LCVYHKGNCATEKLLANLDTITNSVTQFTEILTVVDSLLQNVFGIWWVIYLIHFMICIPVLVNFAYIVFTKLANLSYSRFEEISIFSKGRRLERRLGCPMQICYELL